MKLIKYLLICICFFLLFSSTSKAQEKFKFPNLDAYSTMVCDFHIHTVFSDGLVWPTIRVQEAVNEGIDAIAITDHIEYKPYKDYVKGDFNTSFELAKVQGEKKKIIVIRGCEITRDMPPGHSNAIFMSDNNPIDTKEWKDAFQEAKKQNAFIFWNHPGWKRQQPEKTLWWDEHTWLYNNGLMQGIEVVNGTEYYPEAHQWCLERNLTFLANSDIHNPIGMDYNFSQGKRRPVTLVFVTSKSEEGIKEALLAHRTLLCANGQLIGSEKNLIPFIESCLRVDKVKKLSEGSFEVTVENNSCFTFELSKSGNNELIQYPSKLTVPSGKSSFNISLNAKMNSRNIQLGFLMLNVLYKPSEAYPYTLTVDLPE